MKIAALDFGSNTFLCLIVEKQGDDIKVLWDHVETVRLGQGLGLIENPKEKFFHPEALVRAEKALSLFSEEIKKYGITTVKALATAAAREAQNKAAFINLCDKYKIPLDIISGDEEASLTFKGALSTLKPEFRKSNPVVGNIDIGGASTEITIGDQNQILFRKSFPVGGVKLTEKFQLQKNWKNEKGSFVQKKSEVENELSHIFGDLKNLQSAPVTKFLAVAGTPTETARFLLDKKSGRISKSYDFKNIDGFELTRTQIQDLFTALISMDTKARIDYGISEGRADIMTAGLAILIHVVHGLGIENLTVSARGLRFGLAEKMLVLS